MASFPGSVNRIFCYLILEKHGVPRDSYEYIELLPKDWQTALQTGQIDAVSALEPSASQIMKDGVGVSIFPGFYADLMPDVPLSAHWIAADFYSRANKKQIAAILEVYDRAIDFCRRDELIITKDLRERKAVMEARSDIFVGLPGGIGTLDEILEIIALKQLQFHTKPIIFINTNRFYDHLINHFEHIYQEHFGKPEYRQLYYIASDVASIFSYIEKDQPI